MHYLFPRIEHIDQVLPIIKDKPEFIVAEREHFTIINYMMVGADTFPDVLRYQGTLNFQYSNAAAILRECRGIVFDKNGRILSRRFHKFFNVNEREETLSGNINLTRDHIFLEKLDGSMVTPLYIKDYDEFRWATKMRTVDDPIDESFVDVARLAENFVAGKKNYELAARYCYNADWTPIFEYCSRNNRVVIDYPEEKMVLLAIRNNITGEYFTYSQLTYYASQFDVPLVDFKYTVNMDEIKQLTDTEGYVIRFDDGHMLKVKSEWYVNIHKAKENLLFEKNVIALILDDKTDDLKSFLPDNDRKNLEHFEECFRFSIQRNAVGLMHLFNLIEIQYGDKTTFAKKHAHQLVPITRQLMFRMWESDDRGIVKIESLIIELIKKNLSTQTKVDTMRNHFKWKSW